MRACQFRAEKRVSVLSVRDGQWVDFSQAAREGRADSKSKGIGGQPLHMQGDITTRQSNELASIHPTALWWPASSRRLTATPGRQLGRHWLTRTLYRSPPTERYER